MQATARQRSAEPGDGLACDYPVARAILAAEPDLDKAFNLLAERAPDQLAWLAAHLPESLFHDVGY